jgi:hypothetical protein
MLKYFSKFENRYDSKVDFMERNLGQTADFNELDATRRTQNWMNGEERGMIAYIKSHKSVISDYKRNYFLLNKQLILRHIKKIEMTRALKVQAKRSKKRIMCEIIPFRYFIKKIYHKFAILRF